LRSALLDLEACLDHLLPDAYLRWAHRLTSPTVETVVEMLGNRIAQREVSLVNGYHELHPAAW
jgi:hypothetical protein